MPASDAPTPGSERDAPPEDGDGDPDRSTVALTRTDERVLAYLADVGTDYPAFVASNTGLYVDHVESRLDALDAELEAMEPPVAWAAVEAVVADHQPAVE